MGITEILMMLAVYGIPVVSVVVFVACILTLVRAKRTGASKEKIALAIVGLILSGVVVAFLAFILVLLILIVAGVIPFM